MAVAPQTRAGLIPARQLPELVAKAVKLAEERTGVAPGKNGILLKWELIGRIIREGRQAETFASAVAGELTRQGFRVDPAVAIVNKKIYCGFIERLNVPQLREF